MAGALLTLVCAATLLFHIICISCTDTLRKEYNLTSREKAAMWLLMQESGAPASVAYGLVCKFFQVIPECPLKDDQGRVDEMDLLCNYHHCISGVPASMCNSKRPRE